MSIFSAPQLLHPDLIAEFARAYQEEFNRLAGSFKKSRAQAERDLVKVTRQIGRIVDAIVEGMFHPSMKAKMDTLEERKAMLESEMQSTPVLLYPGLSDVYRGKVANLAEVLNDLATKTEVVEIIRSLLSEVRLSHGR